MASKMPCKCERCGSWPMRSRNRERFHFCGTASSDSMPINFRSDSLRRSSARHASIVGCRRATLNTSTPQATRTGTSSRPLPRAAWSEASRRSSATTSRSFWIVLRVGLSPRASQAKSGLVAWIRMGRGLRALLGSVPTTDRSRTTQLIPVTSRPWSKNRKKNFPRGRGAAISRAFSTALRGRRFSGPL
jgi:hypothetical protein